MKMFAEYITREQERLKLSNLDMSRFLKVSVPTIDRWKRGVTAPHALCEKAVRNALDMLPTLISHQDSDNEIIRESIQKILDGDYEMMKDDDLD